MNAISFHNPRQVQDTFKTQVALQDIREGMKEDVKRKNIEVRLNNSSEGLWPPRGKYLGNVSIMPASISLRFAAMGQDT